MATLETLLSRRGRREVAAPHAPYPREVMEAGWVPELAKLCKLLRGGAEQPAGAPPATGRHR